MGVGTKAAAVKRGQDAVFATQPGIMDRGIRLMTVDMQRAAAAEIENRERVDVFVVMATDDGPLAVLLLDEGE